MEENESGRFVQTLKNLLWVLGKYWKETEHLDSKLNSNFLRMFKVFIEKYNIET